MLVLSRKRNEKIVVGDIVTITVTRIGMNRVSLGIDAPEHMRIYRPETEQPQQPKEQAK